MLVTLKNLSRNTRIFPLHYLARRSLIIDNPIDSVISCLSGKLYLHNDLEEDVGQIYHHREAERQVP